MSIIFIEQCYQQYLQFPNTAGGDQRNPNFNEHHNICVLGRNQESGCMGDSGGPLVWRAKFPNLHSYLIGIISKANAIGAGDCQPPIVPTVITLVLNQQIINWLWSHAGNELQQCLP